MFKTPGNSVEIKKSNKFRHNKYAVEFLIIISDLITTPYELKGKPVIQAHYIFK